MLIFPALRQTFEYDCGAKALQSVLAYYGMDVSEEIVMKEVRTSRREGTDFVNIVAAVRKHGLKVDSKRMSVDDLKRYISKGIPVIVLLQAWVGNEDIAWKDRWHPGHYAVAIGFDSRKIYFEDPAIFNRSFLTYAELEERWHDMTRGRKILNRGIAVYGRKPVYDPKKVVHMD